MDSPLDPAGVSAAAGASAADVDIVDVVHVGCDTILL